MHARLQDCRRRAAVKNFFSFSGRWGGFNDELLFISIAIVLPAEDESAVLAPSLASLQTLPSSYFPLSVAGSHLLSCLPFCSKLLDELLHTNRAKLLSLYTLI
jgi:hypothetical protein